VLALAVLGLAAACNRGQSSPDGDAPRVAFVMKTLNHPFFLDMQRGAEEAAAGTGMQLVVQAAEREIDVEKQVQIIENLLQTGIRVLIVTPSGSRETATAIA
jgi:ribose transport system substrate-binding protein